MLLRSEQIDKRIRSTFYYMFGYVKDSNMSNLQDVNVFLEDFFCELMNILYQYKLVNLNTCKENYPGIDLGDESNGKCVQVTSTTSKAKVEKTLLRYESHKLFEKYPHLMVLLIDINKPKFRGEFAKNGTYTFENDRDILALNDIVLKFRELDDETVEQALQMLEKRILPIHDAVSPDTIEMIIFRELFKIISTELAEDSESEEEIPTDSSDLEKKKERFADYWKFIEDNYKQIFSLKREKIYKKVQDSFSEEDQIRVNEYLKFESRKALALNEDNPIKAIEYLTEKMINKFKLEVLSETEIQYFLYYELYHCYIFPN